MAAREHYAAIIGMAMKDMVARGRRFRDGAADAAIEAMRSPGVGETDMDAAERVLKRESV